MNRLCPPSWRGPGPLARYTKEYTDSAPTVVLAPKVQPGPPWICTVNGT